MADGDGSEQAMDILRVTHHTETFITLLADLGIGVEQALSVEKVSDHLSALADLILQATFERVWSLVAKKFDLRKKFSPNFCHHRLRKIRWQGAWLCFRP
jgi:glutamate-ammonia-ligase adenylyltransferase